MIIQAELKCKQTGCEADPCAVDIIQFFPARRAKWTSWTIRGKFL